jgi:hypothetical protein
MPMRDRTVPRLIDEEDSDESDDDDDERVVYRFLKYAIRPVSPTAEYVFSFSSLEGKV